MAHKLQLGQFLLLLHTRTHTHTHTNTCFTTIYAAAVDLNAVVDSYAAAAVSFAVAVAVVAAD